MTGSCRTALAWVLKLEAASWGYWGSGHLVLKRLGFGFFSAPPSPVFFFPSEVQSGLPRVDTTQLHLCVLASAGGSEKELRSLSWYVSETQHSYQAGWLRAALQGEHRARRNLIALTGRGSFGLSLALAIVVTDLVLGESERRSGKSTQ